MRQLSSGLDHKQGEAVISEKRDSRESHDCPAADWGQIPDYSTMSWSSGKSWQSIQAKDTEIRVGADEAAGIVRARTPEVGAAH